MSKILSKRKEVGGMLKVSRSVLLLLVFSSVGLWASAQSSGSGSAPSGSGTNSSSDSGANSNSGASVNYTNNSVSNVPPMMISTVPGVAGETIPGQAVNNGDLGGFNHDVYRVWTKAYLKAMSKRVSKKSVQYQIAGKLPTEGRDVRLLTWWPEAGIWPGDEVVAVADVYGELHHPEIPYLAKALLILSEQSNSDRCAVAYQSMNTLLTDNSARGIGAQGSGTLLPGGNPAGMNAVIGWYHGESKTGIVSYPHYRVICLNDGSYDLPPSLRPAEPQANNHAASTSAPAPVSVPEQSKLQPEPQPAVLPVAVAAQECQGTPFLVLFAFDKWAVQPKYLGEVHQAARWVVTHPGCTLEINGNTDTVGTVDYNAALGLKRAQEVLKVMVADGGKTVAQRVEIASSGKKYPVPNDAATSRRAILKVVTDPTSVPKNQ
jgi:outer membrane protein OmpA-like peptidoglycan-associated protein